MTEENTALAASFATLARDLAAHRTPTDVLNAIVTSAVATIPGAQEASVTVMTGTRYRTVAATSDLPSLLDNLQHTTGQGPGIAAIAEHHDMLSNDLRAETRWPAFAPHAASEHGVLSILSQHLFLNDIDALGSLNLYATTTNAFPDDIVHRAHIHAAHSTIALAYVTSDEQNTHLQQALDTNRDIGIAMGVLMSTHKITKTAAFDLLKKVSQHTQRKLADIASDVADTGTLDLPPTLKAILRR